MMNDELRNTKIRVEMMYFVESINEQFVDNPKMKITQIRMMINVGTD